MKLFAICVRDSALDAYHAPLFFPAMGLAERWFRDECNSPTSEIAKHPSDYELILVGGFDTDQAELTGQAPRILMRGSDTVQKLSS